MATSTRQRPPSPSARAATQRAQRRRTIVVGAVVLVVIVAIAFLAARSAANSSAERVDLDDIAGAPVIDGEAWSTIPDDITADPVIGTPAPRVEGADFDGNPVAIGDGPQLVTFMASWCPACEQELPELVSWLEQDRLPEGVELVVVNTHPNPGRPNWPPTAWFEQEGYTGAVLADDADSSVAQAYGLPATPSWVAIDADGNAVMRVAGMIDQSQMDALAAMVAD